MSAIIIPFPKISRAVRVVPADGEWLTLWRGWGWPHATEAAAVADAEQIAAVHHVQVLVEEAS